MTMATGAMQRYGAAVWGVMMAHRPTLTVTSPAVLSSSGATPSPILCWRGDIKMKKGKRFKGSYGNARPEREKKIERIKDKVDVPRSTPWPLPFKLI